MHWYTYFVKIINSKSGGFMTSFAETQTGSQEPLYNIGLVSRMTGISMATLRAWERRYAFPESSRTMGGHRLYSERDILRLRWVKKHIDGGMQTSQAIHALHHQEQTGQAVLTEEVFSPAPVLVGDGILSIDRSDREEKRSYLGSIQERLLNGLINRDTQAADESIAEALAIFSPDALILNVVRPALNEIGSLWEQGKISVATEHLATNYLRQRLMMWMVGGPQTHSQHRIVLACAPDEWHEGSILILGALLRRRLWPVIYLGQAVPLPDLAGFVQEINPSLVVMVSMTQKSAENLVDWKKWLPNDAAKKLPIFGFGGRVFVEEPEWRLKIPGIYLGNSFEEGVSTIEKLLR
jgi:DNA-binding transcriptional MerR regulator